MASNIIQAEVIHTPQIIKQCIRETSQLNMTISETNHESISFGVFLFCQNLM